MPLARIERVVRHEMRLHARVDLGVLHARVGAQARDEIADARGAEDAIGAHDMGAHREPSQLRDAQSESAVFFSANNPQDPAQLLTVAKQGIMQVAAASAALSYVQEYNDAATPR